MGSKNLIHQSLRCITVVKQNYIEHSTQLAVFIYEQKLSIFRFLLPL
jgi:hypothetical protein